MPLNTDTTVFNDIFKKLQLMLSEITGNEVEDIRPTSDLMIDLSMSPMEIAQLFAGVESTFKVKLTRTDLEEFETLNDLVTYIEDKIS
jgi:acyl carrier protein